MVYIRDILNEIKWTKELANVRLWYIHRGAPNDTMVLLGSDIVNIGKSYVETKNASIPYHRIILVKYDQQVLFERSKQKKRSS